MASTKSEAKTEIDEIKNPASAVVPTDASGNAVAFAEDEFFGMDTGLEDVSAEDVSLPRYTILQGLSPQVNSRKDEYVEGAKMGMIFNTATGRVVDSQRLVFAAYERRYVEWIPRERPAPFSDLPQVTGGGLYSDYGTDDAVMNECRRYEENGSLWTPRGNELVVTGTWYCIDPDTLSVGFIAMGKTQFTSSKKLMAGIRDEKIVTRAHGIRPAPLFYRVWELGTRLREHDGNEWFTWNHKPNETIQSHPHGVAILEEVRTVVRTLQEGGATIDVGLGETEGEARASNPDDARM